MSTTSTSTTVVDSKKIETPFLSGARKSGSSVEFWKSYVQARPAPTEDFFQLISEYHKSHGDTCTDIAHDVGTGPGNIATRLAAYFNHVVGSDVNPDVLAAAPSLVPAEILNRMTFIQSPAEALAQKTPPEVGGQGTTDLVTVSECMPLLDPPVALKAFYDILRPGGTLGIYFYGPAVFVDGDMERCNAAYDKVATRICTFNQPMKGTPGFPFHLRGAETLLSYMDNINMPEEDWESVERHKWNCDYPLIFNSKAGFDFDFSPVDRRGEKDVTKEVINRNFWGAEWFIQDVESYLDSVYPNYRDKAGASYAEVRDMLEELHDAMGGEKRKVTFPVVLILATKKAATDTTTLARANEVRLSSKNLGLGRSSESPPGSLEMATQLLQKNHDEYHIFWRDANGHNHMAHSLLTHFALGATPSELQRANDDGVSVQRPMPKLDIEVAISFSDENALLQVLGQLPQYTNVLKFFEQQIDQYGWRAILHKYCFAQTKLADIILSRMYEGAHHPFIHLGLGVEFELPSIVAEALAQAVVHPYSGIPDCLLRTDELNTSSNPNEPHKTLIELYKEARSSETIRGGPRWEDGPTKLRDGTLGRSKEAITNLVAQYRVHPSELELRAAEVIGFSAFIAGATQRLDKTPKIDFFHMHNVTSSIFLTVLIQDRWISLENKVRLVEWKGRTDLLWYAANGCPEFNIDEIRNYVEGPSAGMTWGELYHAISVMKDDGHVAKFARALKSAENISLPFENQDAASFPMKGDYFLKLARMCYDSTIGLPDELKWVWGAGFPQAWGNTPARAPIRARKFPSLTAKFHHTAYESIDPTLPTLSAAGKNIVITGGGTGIGAETALRFAQAGASTISIIGRRDSTLQSTKSKIESVVPGAQIFTYTVDVTKKDLVDRAFSAIHSKVGQIHVLVSNAGHISTPTSIKDAAHEDWWRSFEVNVLGAFLTAQAFLHYKSADAVLLYVSSALSHLSAGTNVSSYSAGKAGAVRMFTTLQMEHPELRVVCLHPGTIATDMLTKSGHNGDVDDVSLPACTMVWLASPEASFLKGKYIWANWDVGEMKSRAEEISGGEILTLQLSGWPFAQK